MKRLIGILLAVLPFWCANAQIGSLEQEIGSLLKEKRYTEVIETIDRLLLSMPDSAETLLSTKAYCFYKMKKHTQATETLSQIEEYELTDSISDALNLYYTYMNKDIEGLKNRATELMETNPDLFLRQLRILEKKDLDKLTDAFSKSLTEEDREDSPEFATTLGLMHYADSNLMASYNELINTIVSYPTPHSFFILGKVMCQSKQYLSAIAYFNRAESLGMKTESLYAERSKAKGFDKDFEGAIEDVNICLAVRPSDELYCLRGIYYTNLLQYDKALADLNNALRMNDTTAQYHNQKGIVYTNLGKYSEAVASFQTALALDETLPYVHGNLAIALEKAGFKEQAVEHYKINLKLHPDHADTYFNLGRIAYSEKRFKDAIKLLSNSHDLNPKYSETQYLLGLAYIKTSKPDLACFYFHLALENQNPNAAEAIKTHCDKESEAPNPQSESSSKASKKKNRKSKKTTDESENAEEESETQDEYSEDESD